MRRGLVCGPSFRHPRLGLAPAASNTRTVALLERLAMSMAVCPRSFMALTWAPASMSMRTKLIAPVAAAFINGVLAAFPAVELTSARRWSNTCITACRASSWSAPLAIMCNAVHPAGRLFCGVFASTSSCGKHCATASNSWMTSGSSPADSRKRSMAQWSGVWPPSLMDMRLVKPHCLAHRSAICSCETGAAAAALLLDGGGLPASAGVLAWLA